jgi:hypothetical protein
MWNDLAKLTFAVLVVLGGWSSSARAELRFAQPTVELGRVRTGIPLTHSFSFVVVGPAPVEITDINASCGCLAPRLTKRLYQEGEKGTLNVELNTLSQPAGRHAWRIQVLYRVEKLTYEMVLRLNADLVTEVTVQPSALVLSVDRSIQREIVVKDVRPTPFNISAVRVSSAALSARAEPPSRDEAGHWVWRIVLDVKPDGPDGRRDELLGIFTDDPDYRELRVPVTLIKRAAQQLSATPAELTLSAPSGQPIPSQRVLIRDRDGRPVEIERVEAGDPALQVQWADGAHSAAVVKVTVDRNRLRSGELKTVLQVHIKEPLREVIVVPITVRMH